MSHLLTTGKRYLVIANYMYLFLYGFYSYGLIFYYFLSSYLIAIFDIFKANNITHS